MWWVALLTLDALAGRHYIAGQILDRNGEPIDRAVVTVDPGNVQLVTDREGQFLVDYLRDEDGERIKLAKKTDYVVEVFKPGFHIRTVSLSYRKGAVQLEPFTLVEETIEIADDGAELDPELYPNATHAGGANYEGQ